jgi:hypothetical protein
MTPPAHKLAPATPATPAQTSAPTTGQLARRPTAIPARAATPAKKAKSGTVSMLRRFQIAVAGLMIVLGGATLALGNAATAQNDTSASSGAQAIRLTTVATNLLQADQLASECLLAGSQSRLGDLRTALDRADRLIVNAAADSPADREWLGQLNATVSRYGRALEQAATSRNAANLNAAEKLLQDEILVVLEQNAALAINQVAVPRFQQSAITAVAWLAVAILIAICVPVARASHRVVNLGLLSTLAAALVIASWSSITLFATPGDFQSIYDAGRARSAVVNTRLTDFRAARPGASQSDTTAAMKQWDGYADQARSLLNEARSLNDSGLAYPLSEYLNQHEALATALRQGNLDEAKKLLLDSADGSLRQRSDTFDTDVLGFQDAQLAQSRASLDANGASLRALSNLASLIALGGMIGGIWGLNRRLREFE